MVLEAENGKETITFSSVTKPAAAASSTPAPGRRKKPSKVKKDRKRKEAWLEKRSQGKENPSQTEKYLPLSSRIFCKALLLC